jgi:acyl carrier protein
MTELTNSLGGASSPTRRLILDTLWQCERPAGIVADNVEDDLPLGPGGLGVSSLSLLQVFVKLEEKLGFAFDDAAVANATFTTVGELTTFVEEVLSRQRRDRSGGVTRPESEGS